MPVLFLELDKVKNIKIKPSILLCPSIPPPLHGLNPRTIMGKTWWDKERKKAYRKHDGCCMACGKKAKLEAHEMYRYEYKNKRAWLYEIVAVCVDCHLFIHYGRTNILAQTGRLDKKRFKKIIQDKMELLKEHDMIEEAMKTKLIPPIDNFGDDWTEWHIIIYGIKYYSKFKNRADWKNKYNATLI